VRYQNDESIPKIIEISELLYKFLSNFCKKIQIIYTFKFGFTCNWKKCKHFAGVELQYPYSTKKYCEKCKKFTKLDSEEMAWLISQDILNPMVCMYVSSLSIILFVHIWA